MKLSLKRGFGPSGVIFCAFFTFAAIACAGTYSGGAGTAEDPYQIATKGDLLALRNTTGDYGKCFVLTADIDLTGQYFSHAVIGWFINDQYSWFKGTFDGNHHIISNLTITTSSNDYIGLFGLVGSGGQIRNLGVKNANIIGGDKVGTLVGHNSGGTIVGCYATGFLKGSEDVGGLVGHISGISSMITACYSHSAVTGGTDTGGLVGYNCGKITNCYATGTVSYSGYVGGLVGNNVSCGIIEDCFATGSVEGWYAGGLVGLNSGTAMSCYASGTVNSSSKDGRIGGLLGYNSNGTVTACYANGPVSGTGDKSDVGGLVGGNGSGTITACYAIGTVSGSGNESYVGGLVGGNWSSTITACYATGFVSGSGTETLVGGLVGSNSEGIITASFWDMLTSGQVNRGGGIGLTTEQMKTQSVYQNAGWADKGWVIQDGADYPRLSWENTGGAPIPPSSAIPLNGSGTAEDPYRISTVEEFALMHWYSGILNSHIQLTADLDLSVIPLNPIGDLGPFTGDFDGNGHTLSHGAIHQSGSDDVGLFSRVGSGGQIRNLVIEDVTIIGRNRVGGLVGWNDGCTITACYASGTINGSEYVGGLVGRNSEGTITDCSTSGAVSGSFSVGGLVGNNSSGTITASSSTSTVGNSGSIGGLVGSNSDGTITNCFATGAISGSGAVGGLVGYSDDSTIISCCATGSVSGSGYGSDIGGLIGHNYGSTVTACYAAGSVKGTENIDYRNIVGGLVGYNSNSTITVCYAIGTVGSSSSSGGLVADVDKSTIVASFWDIQTSGRGQSWGGKGLTTEQMKNIATYQNAGWGNQGWVMQNGVDYPRLAWENTGYPPIPGPEPIALAGSGTLDDPYQIHTIEEFAGLSYYAAVSDYHYRLMEDLDANGISLYPIGDGQNPYTGFFDGDGHVIRNATITLPVCDYVGLFGCLGAGGEIKNLHVENCTITGYQYVGGLVGRSYGSLAACYATGTVSGSGQYGSIGGLCGKNENGTIGDCSIKGIVEGGLKSYGVGGVCGYNLNGIIQRSTASCTVRGSSGVGGLCGKNDKGSILSSCARGTILGNDGSGGLGGLCGWNNTGTIKGCYAVGAVVGDYQSKYVGGLCGENNQGTISSCYASCYIDRGESELGGFCGYNRSGTIQSCFWNTDIYARAGYLDGTGKATLEMKTPATFTGAGWDFSDIDGDSADWKMSDNDYPRLKWEVLPTFSGGSGSETDPFRIETVLDWKTLAEDLRYWDRYYVLTADIDFQDKSLVPIAADQDRTTDTIDYPEFQGTPFTGVFDGNGHVLHHVTINRPGESYIGLWGTVGKEARIHHLQINNITVSGHSYIGSLCGRNWGGEIDACSIEGIINGDDRSKSLGGLCGANGGVVRDCAAMTTITCGNNAQYIGGLCGSGGTIQECLASCAITVGENAFGIGGMTGYGGSINSSISEGKVTGGISSCGIGGFCGYKSGEGAMENCYSTTSICVGEESQCLGGFLGYSYNNIMQNCFSSGAIVAGPNSTAVGGLCGSSSNGRINWCFWDIEISGLDQSAAGKGLTTGQMKTLLIFQNAGWGGKGWVMKDGEDYPRLDWENTGGVPIPEPGVIPLIGSGTQDDPYQIHTAEDFASLSWYIVILDKQIRLMADVDLQDMILYPIGNLGVPFTGTFDGNGYSIRNAAIKFPNRDYLGLFGYLDISGLLINIRAEEVLITGHDFLGGICACNHAGTIDRCFSSGRVTGNSYLGGLCGSHMMGTIRNCAVSCIIAGGDQSSYIGGLCGRNSNYDNYSKIGDGLITDCVATGEISGGDWSYYLGGLCGSNDSGSIYHSVATSSVTGGSYSYYLGGLSGYNWGSIQKCHAEGNIVGGDNSSSIGGLCGEHGGGNEISRCSAGGTVSGGVGSKSLGGLCGYNHGMISRSNYSGSIQGDLQVGGLLGYDYCGTLTLCCTMGSVIGSGSVGGLIGYSQNTKVSSCYAENSVEGISAVGGLVGYAECGTMTHCFSYGKVTGSSSVGGMVGMIYSYYCTTPMFTSCFWDKQTSGQSRTAGGTGKTTAEMQMISTYLNAKWDFVGENTNGTGDVWRMCGDGGAYPRLSWEFSRGGDMDCPDGVALEDLLYLAGRWMASTPSGIGAADGDADGRVDLADFAILASEWMRE